MRDAQALYSMDPVRRDLVPYMIELLEATHADRCALVWSPMDGSPGDFPHIVIDAAKDEPRVTFGAGLAARGLAAALDGSVGTDRARRTNNLAYGIAAKHDRKWSLVLSGARKLRLGRDVGHIFRQSRGRAYSVLIDIDDESLWDQRKETDAVVAQAEDAEAAGDYEAALDLYEVARSACLAMGLAESGIRATWYHGRTLRKLGRLDEALALYELAEGAACQMTDQSLAAAIMTGRATIYRLRGNLPLARTTYKEALRVSPADTVAIPLAYYGLMVSEREVGALAAAVRYGWRAFDAYASTDPDRYGTLVVLGNILVECGDLGAAEDAYEIVLGSNQKDIDIRVTATNGLAQTAARRGDITRYEAMLDRLEKHGQGKVQAKVMTQVLLDRARDEVILGREDRAREALEEATALAERHTLGRLIIESDEIQVMLDNSEPAPQRPVVKGTNRVRGKLKELRSTLSA